MKNKKAHRWSSRTGYRTRQSVRVWDGAMNDEWDRGLQGGREYICKREQGQNEPDLTILMTKNRAL